MRNRTIPVLSDDDQEFICSLILHEDDAVLAFNKPSGLPSQVRGNRARNLDHLLWAFARSNGKRPRLVHRLDSGTSGVIIAAKTKPAAAALSAAFESGAARKTYLALVQGEVAGPSKGVIDAPIARVETDRGMQIVAGDARGKAARTRWRIAAAGPTARLLEVRPETGRTHQIRVHLAHRGAPIFGDRIYGDKATAPRLMLHAWRLQLPHPDGSTLDLEAAPPADFTAVLDAHTVTFT